MKKQEKIFAVADLKERLKEAKAVILTDYQGLTVPQMNQLRSLVKKAGGQILVVKNTLLERALKEAKLPKLELTGQTAVVLAYQDEISPIKSVFDFARSTGLPSFKTGIWEERILSREEIERLGSLPSHQELLGKLSSILSSPSSRLTQVLAGNQKKLIMILKTKGGEN